MHLSQLAYTPTALARSKKPNCRSILRPTYRYTTQENHAYGDRGSQERSPPRTRISLPEKYSYYQEHLHERSALWHPTIEARLLRQTIPETKRSYRGWQSTNEALLLPRTSARAKCTYWEDTLWLIHLHHQKLSLNRSKLAAIHSAARSAFTVETYPNPQTDYDHHGDYDDRSEHNYHRQSKSPYCQWFSTAMTLTATEAIRDYYYLQTE